VAFEASPKPENALPDGFTASEAIKRLQAFKHADQPFFLAVGFVKPHLPFIAPAPYWDLYDPDRIPIPRTDTLPDGAPEFAGHASGELHNYGNIPEGNPIPETLARSLRHGYYACISYVDAQVGRLLEALEEAGLSDNTVVVLWGDHGWQLGDHGIWAKHTNFELATRSPLIIAVPGQQASGTVSRSLVEFVDVYPTLADACGLEVPDGLDGQSLVPLLDDPGATVRRVALSQYPRGGGKAGHGPLMGYSLRDERWRLTVWRDRRDGEIVVTELYDEREDPAETRNLAAVHPEVVVRLSRFLPSMPSFERPRPSASTPAAAPSGSRWDRAVLFAQRDQNRDDQLDYEEFSAHHRDLQDARIRFSKWDTNGDGGLSDQEYITQGGTVTP
jgi:iduronate 2-sulfatase